MSKLYVVGTPIGNLEDFSPRGVRILNEVDFIAAEDTRVTQKLLNHFGIKKETVSYFEHNKEEKGPYIVNRIANGEICALVTDAGMPAISDPGEELVYLCRMSNIDVESIPGPCAFATALAISGFDSRRFCFEGFLEQDNSQINAHLSALVHEERTILFYEAPHRLIKTLKNMERFLANRMVCIAKELTKIHECVLYGSFEDLIKYYESYPPKGEYVIIIEGATPRKKAYTLDEAIELAKDLCDKGLKKTEAAKQSAALTGIKKSEIYTNL